MIIYGAYLGTDKEMKIKERQRIIPYIMQVNGVYMALIPQESGGVVLKACNELEYARKILLIKGAEYITKDKMDL